jgi:hypothetical protein
MSDADSQNMRFALEKLNHNKLLRILAPLVHKGVALSRNGDKAGSFGYEAGKPIARSPDRGAPEAVISADDVEALRARDLIEPSPGGYRLSAAGRAWLKRELAAGDHFQAQHSVRRASLFETEEGREQVVIVNDAESPLAWLASRKDKSGAPLISPHQFAAGERLRADYTYGALTPRMTARYSNQPAGPRGGGNNAAHLSDTVLAARQRVSRALAAVGPELAGVLVDVCCHLKGLEEAERDEGWPKRSGKVILQMALNALARHYGLVSDGQSSAGLHRRLQHWGASDYRPSADGGGRQEAC